MADGNRRRLLTLGIAGGGVLLAHWLTYLVDAPDPVARGAALAATGHGYLGAAGELASALLAISIVAVFLGALVDRSGRSSASLEGYRFAPSARRWLAARLALLQIGVFAGMEVVERLVADAPLSDLARGWILPVGIVVNLIVALIGAALLRWIVDAAERVADAVPASRPATAFPRATLGVLPTSTFVRASPGVLGTVWARGPPAPLGS